MGIAVLLMLKYDIIIALAWIIAISFAIAFASVKASELGTEPFFQRPRTRSLIAIMTVATFIATIICLESGSAGTNAITYLLQAPPYLTLLRGLVSSVAAGLTTFSVGLLLVQNKPRRIGG
jgi:hypothetical protein